MVTLCGGDTVVEIVGRAMKKIMVDEVASKFSMKGQKGNENFSETKTWGIVKCKSPNFKYKLFLLIWFTEFFYYLFVDAVLSIQSLQPTEKKIEKAVSEWFRHSNGRLKDKLAKEIKATTASA